MNRIPRVRVKGHPRSIPPGAFPSVEGPFRVWVKGPTKHVLVTQTYHRPTARRKLTQRQHYDLNIARQKHVGLRRQLQSWQRRGKITPKEHEQLKEFVRDFTYSLRRVANRDTYRVPTLDELINFFPFLRGKFSPSHEKRVRRYSG